MDGISDIEPNSGKNGCTEGFVHRRGSDGMPGVISPTSPASPESLFTNKKEKKEQIAKKPNFPKEKSAPLPLSDILAAKQKFLKSKMSPTEKLRLEPLTTALEYQPMDATPVVTREANINSERAINQDFKPMLSKLRANPGTTGGQ